MGQEAKLLLSDLPSENGLQPSARYTDGAYMAANPSWHAEDAPWKFAQMLKIFEAEAMSLKRICEVGSGSGVCLDLVQRYFSKSVADGYEISPQAFDLCRLLQRPGLNFYNGSAFDTGKHYDLAMAIDVIEHVEDPFAFARGMARISDMQLFHIPLDMNVLALLREWPILHARKDVGHIHYFSRRTAMALAEDCGLEVVRWRYAPWAIDQRRGFSKWAGQAPRHVAHAFSPDWAVRVLGGWSLMLLTRSKHG